MRLTRTTPIKLDDEKAERARREHASAITELQEHVRAALPVVGAAVYLGRQVFTASAQYTPASGARRAIVRMVGGGGGGGGAQGGANHAGGGGGGSGSYLEIHISTSHLLGGGAVAIGAGGAGGAATPANGVAGGDTLASINGITYTAKGGGGGGQMTSQITSATLGGAPQAGSTSGVDATAGSPGEVGVALNAGNWWGGAGGSNPLGSGGGQVGGDSVGVAGAGYGGGGGGGATAATGRAGGAGASGVVIIDEWT